MLTGDGAAEVVMDTLSVGEDEVLGEIGGGVALVELALDHGIAAAFGEAIGTLGHLVPATAEYTRTREQYGAPLAKFQVLQHRMADMYIQTETARSMAYVAAMSLNDDPVERARIVPAAQVQIGQSGKFVGYPAVQLPGGPGVAAELVLLAVAILLFAPFLAGGGAFGRQVAGAVAPVGVSMAFGALLFGIGMQLGGGCASGTLSTAGGGTWRPGLEI